MKFFPKDICEKLVRLGCKNDSAFSYFPLAHTEKDPPVFRDRECEVPAFTILDFIDHTKQAKENCKMVFGDAPGWELERHAIIDSPDGIEYVTKAIEKIE